jgi:pseudouridine kinase
MTWPDRKAAVVCFGGAVVDRKYHAVETLRAGTSNPASGSRSHGGVARNIAETLARLDISTSLISAIGDDESGRSLIGALQRLGVDVSAISVSAAHGTAEYVALLQPDKSLAFGIADMGIFETLTVEKLNQDWPLLLSAGWVFADCNLPQATLRALIIGAKHASFKLAIDAVSVHKVARLPEDLSGVETLFINLDEAAGSLGASAPPKTLIGRLAARGATSVVLTMGENGLLVMEEGATCHLPAIATNVVDVTGAGDSLIAGSLYGRLHGLPLSEAAGLGNQLARLTLETKDSVRQDLTPAMLKEYLWTS